MKTRGGYVMISMLRVIHTIAFLVERCRIGDIIQFFDVFKQPQQGAN